MTGVFFEIDNIAFLIAVTFAVLVAFLQRWTQNFLTPTLFFSDLQTLKASPSGFRTSFSNLPRKLLIGALFFFLAAFSDPHLFLTKKTTEGGAPVHPKPLPTEGIAMYLVLDQSGSMAEKVTARSEGKRIQISKIQLMKELTRQFIEGNPSKNLEGRPNDLIGLVTFARAARVLAPLTLDHQAVLSQLSKLDVVKSTDEDGTSIGYAIFKTANLIDATRHYSENIKGDGKPSYEIKSFVIILVTDGFQDPNPLDKGKRLRNIDLEEAAEYAKEKGIRLYLINVEPQIASSEYAPQRRLMQRITELTGGKFYLVDSTTSLGDIYADIDKLEKSAISSEGTQEEIRKTSKDKQPNLYRRISFYPYLVALGMLLLFFSILLNTTILRKIP